MNIPLLLFLIWAVMIAGAGLAFLPGLVIVLRDPTIILEMHRIGWFTVEDAAQYNCKYVCRCLILALLIEEVLEFRPVDRRSTEAFRPWKMVRFEYRIVQERPRRRRKLLERLKELLEPPPRPVPLPIPVRNSRRPH